MSDKEISKMVNKARNDKVERKRIQQKLNAEARAEAAHRKKSEGK